MTGVKEPSLPWLAMASSCPEWIDLRRAGNLCPVLEEEWTLFHAGPPLAGAEAIGPLKGAAVGALMYEGLARDEAEEIVKKGRIRWLSGQDYGFASPLVGVVSRSMPAWVVRDANTGCEGFAPLNEGLGEVLRFGANSSEVIKRLKWIERVLGPCLKRLLMQVGKVDVSSLVVKGLECGDELHNRNMASTSHFVRHYAREILRADNSNAEEIFLFLRYHDHFLLNLSLAAAKSTCESAQATGSGDIVTGMAMNGAVFGIRISGLGSRWYCTPAKPLEGRILKGYTAADAAPGIGDSLLIECCGLGGFALGASPLVCDYLGGTYEDLSAEAETMYLITEGEHPLYRLPGNGRRGVPLGISVERVLNTGIAPIFNGGIAHKEAGVGQIGAGVGRLPIECFEAAAKDLRARISVN